jgi:hypothetical protein
MANQIVAGNGTNNGLAVTSDATGTLNILTGSGAGTTAITVDSSQNVGIGTSNPLQRFNAVNVAITGGAPATSGSAADPNAVARFQAGSVAMDIGVYAAGQMWIQNRLFTNYATNYDLFLQPNGGNVLVTGGGGLGYGTGAGGSVTQLTSRTTGVTLNKPTGAITMFTAAGSVTAATFTVTNSFVAATDTISVNQKSGTNLYNFIVTAVAAGSFNITFYTTGGTASDAPVINFNVIKGVTA